MTNVGGYELRPPRGAKDDMRPVPAGRCGLAPGPTARRGRDRKRRY